MNQDEVIPQIKTLPFMDALSRGYTDLSKFPKWAWMFEIKDGMLDRCHESVITLYTDGRETRYCRETYVRVTVDNNQHVVIALMKIEPRTTQEYVVNFDYVALVPRFMGILKDAEGYIIFYMADGKVADAVKSLDLSPSIVVNIINDHFSPPFHVIVKEPIKDVLFSAIRKINIMKLEPAVRDELVNQLKSVDEDVVFL